MAPNPKSENRNPRAHPDSITTLKPFFPKQQAGDRTPPPQPGGLAESSQGSESAQTPGEGVEQYPHPGGVPEASDPPVLALLPGCVIRASAPGAWSTGPGFGFRISGFGFLSDFGFRISDFHQPIRLFLVFLFCWSAIFSRPASAETASFFNPTPIAIPDAGSGSPYPSSIWVSGLTGVVNRATVTLSNLTHSFSPDLDVLLVAPNGRGVVLMADAGAPMEVRHATLVFDDAAAAPPPGSSQLISGTFQPANQGYPGPFGSPAPPPPYDTALAAFNGINPNGLWRLFVWDGRHRRFRNDRRRLESDPNGGGDPFAFHCRCLDGGRRRRLDEHGIHRESLAPLQPNRIGRGRHDERQPPLRAAIMESGRKPCYLRREQRRGSSACRFRATWPGSPTSAFTSACNIPRMPCSPRAQAERNDYR